ncbi:MAG: hypothetical protein WC971_05020 [Coriobacteriia bacterium]
MSSHFGKSRLRKSISSVLSVAMVLSLVILPVTPTVAATAATGGPTVTSGGTNLSSVVSTTTSSNGINGTHRLDVTGTIATQSELRGARYVQGGDLIADMNVTNTIIAIQTTDTAGYSTITTITGLLSTATVNVVIAAINSQVTSVTASIRGQYIYITAKKVGDYGIGVLGISGIATPAAEGTRSLAAKLFSLGPNDIYYYGAPYITGTNTAYGTAYGTMLVRGDDYGASPYGGAVAFTVSDRFVGSTMTSYAPFAQPVSGHLNANFSPARFEATVETATGFKTAVRLGEGYDLVLYTGSGSTGLGKGTALVSVSGGARDNVVPTSFEVSAGPVGTSFVTTLAAGVVATQVVLSLDPTAAVLAATDETHVIEAASFTAPTGFVVSTAVAAQARAQVSHDDGSGSEPASVTVSGQVISVTNFSMNPTESLSVTLTVNAPTAMGVYTWTGTYTNMSDTARAMFSDPNVTTDGNRDITVWPLYAVSSIAFTQPSGYYGRAGTTITVYARAFDRYSNPVGNYWPTHFVYFDVPGSSPVVPTTTVNAFDTASQMLQYTYKIPSTPGTSTIRAFIAGEATTTVNVISTGVGAPAAMVLSSAKNPNPAPTGATAGTAIPTTFTVSFVDANGRPAGFTSSDLPPVRNIKIFYGSAGVSSTVVSLYGTIATMTSSEITFTLNGYAGETWNMWAADYQVGALPQSNVVAQSFGEAAAAAVVSTAISVTVSPVTLVGSSTAGYAAADGLHPVTLTVRGVVGHTISVVASNAVGGLDDSVLPGSLSASSAVVGTSGVVTFNVLSTFPSMRGTTRAWKNWQISDETSGVVVVPPLLVQTHFFAPTLSSPLAVDKTHVLANNADVALYSATVRDPIASAPVVGTTIWFNKTAGSVGTLSSASATTNASGIAQVSIKSAVSGNATVTARDFSGTNEVTAAVVTFDDIQAQASSTAAITAQQSLRGPRPSFGIKLVDSSNNPVTFNVASIDSITGTDTVSGITTSVAGNVISVTCTLPGTSVASSTPVQLVISGRAWVTDALGSSSLKSFQGIIPVTIVNNATATGSGSNLAAGGTLSGTGFRVPSVTATESCTVFLKFGTSWLSIGTVIVGADGVLQQVAIDCRGVIAGTYDLKIDGITFTQGFSVTNVLSTTPVNLTLYRDPMSTANVAPGTAVVVRGAITNGVNGGRLARHIVLQSAAVGSDTWTNIDQVDTSSEGMYAWTVRPTVSTQYRARFEGDAGYAAGNSTAVTIGVTTAPAVTRIYVNSPDGVAYVQRHGYAVNVNGWVSSAAPRVRVYMYRYYNGAYRYVRFYYAVKSGTRYSARIVFPYAGKYRLRAYVVPTATTSRAYSIYRYYSVR